MPPRALAASSSLRTSCLGGVTFRWGGAFAGSDVHAGSRLACFCKPLRHPHPVAPPAPMVASLQHDIPTLAAEAAAAHPSVQCVLAEPIGIDALMAQLIENRVASAQQSGKAVAPAEAVAGASTAA